MGSVKNYSEYLDGAKNETEINISPENDYVYLLKIEDVENIVNAFIDTKISREAIMEELENYENIKIEDVKLKSVSEDEDDDDDDDNDEDEDEDDDNDEDDDDDNIDSIKKFGKV